MESSGLPKLAQKCKQKKKEGLQRYTPYYTEYYFLQVSASFWTTIQKFRRQEHTKYSLYVFNFWMMFTSVLYGIIMFPDRGWSLCIWRLAAIILNSQSQRSKKGWASILGPQKLLIIRSGMLHRVSNLVRLFEQLLMKVALGMVFGKQNVMNSCRLGSFLFPIRVTWLETTHF
jgi:hypothetical protein